MAKLVQLKQNGVEVFPRTVSNAVAVEAKNRLLSTVLTDVETEALGWSIEPTTPGSTLSYTLYQTTSADGVTGKTAVSTFTVDQETFLSGVTYIESSHTMEFVFNTESGKEVIDVSLEDLVDVYTADGSGITEANGQFSLVLDPDTGNIITKSATGLKATIAAEGDDYVSADIDANANNKVVVGANMGTVTYTAAAGDDPADLSGTSGLTDAQEVATAVKSYVDAKVAEAESAVDNLNAVKDDTASGITVEVTQESGLVTNVAVTVDAITDSGMTGTLTGKLVEAQAIKDYVDAQIAGKDAGVSASTEDGFISITVEEVDGALTAAGVTAVTQDVTTASSSAKGLAEASDVKGYVDNQVSALSISASGDTYVNAAVDASNNKKINVTTNLASVTYADSALTIGATEGVVNAAGATAIKNYIDAKTGDLAAAIADLDADVSGETSDGYINVQVVEANGVITDVNVTDVVQEVSTATANDKGLAEAYDVKTYVDGEIQKLDATQSALTSGISVTVAEVDGKLTGVTVAVDAITDSAMTETLTGKLVEAQAIKDYVDSKSAAITIYQTNDITPSEHSGGGTDLAINFANSGATDATEGTSNAVFNPNQELAINGKQVYVWGVTAEDKGDITITWPGEETQNNEPEEP